MCGGLRTEVSILALLSDQRGATQVTPPPLSELRSPEGRTQPRREREGEGIRETACAVWFIRFARAGFDG